MGIIGRVGWLRSIFSGHNPGGTREAIRLAFRQNLRRGDRMPPLQRRWDAAAHTILIRYRARGIHKPEKLVALEAGPFAFLDDQRCEDSLAEYVVMGEHRGEGDWNLIQDAVRTGIVAFQHHDDPEFAPMKVEMFRAIDGNMLPWVHALNDEDTLQRIFDGMKEALEQMGVDTSQMTDD